jgi:hypothetical protein
MKSGPVAIASPAPPVLRLKIQSQIDPAMRPPSRVFRPYPRSSQSPDDLTPIAASRLQPARPQAHSASEAMKTPTEAKEIISRINHVIALLPFCSLFVPNFLTRVKRHHQATDDDFRQFWG